MLALPIEPVVDLGEGEKSVPATTNRLRKIGMSPTPIGNRGPGNASKTGNLSSGNKSVGRHVHRTTVHNFGGVCDKFTVTSSTDVGAIL